MQSLIAFTKHAAVRTQLARFAVFAQPANASFAKIADKEKGDEKNFFNKEDEKLLKGLLKKMNSQVKAAEHAPEEGKKSADALKELLKKHKIDEAEHKELFQALVDWKAKSIWNKWLKLLTNLIILS